MKKNIVIDHSYNKFTIDEILNMTAGYEEVDILSDFNEVFDLVHQLTEKGGRANPYLVLRGKAYPAAELKKIMGDDYNYPYERVLRIEF